MIYMFIAEGFEEIEALCPLDIIRRAGLEIRTVGIGGKEITGAHSITVTTDMSDAEYAALDDKTAEMVFLPGGMPGTLNLAASEIVINAVRDAFDNGRYIAAICAAPLVLGRRGLLKGKEATCYPGFENELVGAEISSFSVVTDGNITTAKGMGAALGFATELVRIFCGEEKAKQLSEAVMDE